MIRMTPSEKIIRCVNPYHISHPDDICLPQNITALEDTYSPSNTPYLGDTYAPTWVSAAQTCSDIGHSLRHQLTPKLCSRII